MFNSLSGIITEKGNQRVFLETNGIEWDIAVPSTSIDALGAVGEQGRLFVWLQHTDSAMNLYGFSSAKERELFFELLKVDGIGPKGALKIMSNITAASLSALLESGDVAALSKVPGVGKKASKMLLSLKGKLQLDALPAAKSAKSSSPYVAVIDSLSDMGYDKRDAEAVIERLLKELQASEDFVKMLPTQKEDLLFKRSIVEMAR